MSKVYIFVKQKDSELPPRGMLDIASKMTPDDFMVVVDQTADDLFPMVFDINGPMDHVVTYENEFVEKE